MAHGTPAKCTYSMKMAFGTANSQSDFCGEVALV